jgi:hypothetical protein
LNPANPLPKPQDCFILMKLKEVLYFESNVLELSSPITICGDIHGQLYDLFQLFETFLSQRAQIEISDTILPLRVNHECRQVNQSYGFYPECQERYGHLGIWLLCNEVFDLLPAAATLIAAYLQCMAGYRRISPSLRKSDFCHEMMNSRQAGRCAILRGPIRIRGRTNEK